MVKLPIPNQNIIQRVIYFLAFILFDFDRKYVRRFEAIIELRIDYSPLLDKFIALFLSSLSELSETKSRKVLSKNFGMIFLKLDFFNFSKANPIK